MRYHCCADWVETKGKFLKARQEIGWKQKVEWYKGPKCGHYRWNPRPKHHPNINTPKTIDSANIVSDCWLRSERVTLRAIEWKVEEKIRRSRTWWKTHNSTRSIFQKGKNYLFRCSNYPKLQWTSVSDNLSNRVIVIGCEWYLSFWCVMVTENKWE